MKRERESARALTEFIDVFMYEEEGRKEGWCGLMM
jgi:hypothetical protein